MNAPSTVRFALKWLGSYVAAKQSSRRGYTEKRDEAKTWKSRRAVDLFLSRKDPGWAASCVVEEFDSAKKDR